MAEFDRINGEFVVTRCTFAEKDFFKNGGWKYNFNRRKWITTSTELALPLHEFAVGAAKEHLDNVADLANAAHDASWAEDTDADFPSPEGLAYMPFQKAGIAYAIERQRTMISDPPGLGKSLILNEKILTDVGWKPIGEAKIGDQIAGRHGFTTITGVYPQGIRPTFRVQFNDGHHVDCSEDHLWTIHNKYWREKERTVTTKDMIEMGLEYNGRPKFSLPLIAPVPHSDKYLPIDPYLLGYMLGNGYFGRMLSVTVPIDAPEIRDRLSAAVSGACSIKWSPPRNGAVQGRISKNVPSNKTHRYMQAIRDLGLYRQLGHYKHIPDVYKFASIEQRTDLLRGLMDSDGCAEKGNSNRYYTTSPSLAKDVVELVQSLGGSSDYRVKTSDGFRDIYSVRVFTGSINPFWWKANRFKPQNLYRGKKRFVTAIERVQDLEQICIAVDSPDRLFLTTGYCPTHNTIQAIGVHNTVKMDTILIVVPASLKVNWEREWVKWDIHGLTVGIAHSKSRSKTVEGVTERWTEYNWPETDVVIINYDMMPQFDSEIKAKTWDLMICDEAHLLKTQKALRTICIFGGRRPGNKKMKRKAKTYTPVLATRSLFLTGTPILSRPDELWTMIKACDRQGLGRNWEKYVERYCGAYYDGFGYDTSGATNSEELNRILRERFMVRRDKKSVLKELPDKTRELIMVPADNLEAIVRKEKSRAEAALNAYEAVLGIETSMDLIDTVVRLSERLGKAMEMQDEEPSWEEGIKQLSEPDQVLFTELSLMREEVALAKVGFVVDHIKGLVECEEPVIAFAHHKTVIEEIRSRLEGQGISVGVITGQVSHKKRQQVVDDFQAGKYDVIIGNLIAMGVGFTLTRASIVVFAELDWVPAMMEQGEDRAWRIGQENAVLVQYLLVNGTIESVLAQAILRKMKVIKRTLDRDDPQ